MVKLNVKEAAIAELDVNWLTNNQQQQQQLNGNQCQSNGYKSDVPQSSNENLNPNVANWQQYAQHLQPQQWPPLVAFSEVKVSKPSVIISGAIWSKVFLIKFEFNYFRRHVIKRRHLIKRRQLIERRQLIKRRHVIERRHLIKRFLKNSSLIISGANWSNGFFWFKKKFKYSKRKIFRYSVLYFGHFCVENYCCNFI